MRNLVWYKNRIYRKYATDLWGVIILRSKPDRTFRFLMQIFSFKLRRKHMPRPRGGQNRFNKINNNKKIFNFFTEAFNDHSFSFTGDADESIENEDFKKKEKDEERLDYLGLKRSKKPFKIHEKLNFISNLTLHKWKYFFIMNLNTFYFNKKIKKKHSIQYFLSFMKYSIRTSFYEAQVLNQTLKVEKKEDHWKHRKKRTLWKLADEQNDYRNRINSYTTWLDCERKFKIKKKSAWWKLRMALRKISIFYGFFSLKKFRYSNKFIIRNTILNPSIVTKLETMLNVLLFRSNLFSNIYFSNNFIKNGGVYVNNKINIYPFKLVKKGDIVIVNKIYFKKIFNIFFKKLFFSKKLLIKNKKFKFYNNLNATKIMINYPSYLEINYKILHLLLWRYPKKNEVLGPLGGLMIRSNHDWAIDSELEY